jgi:hypothetical protein
MLIDCDRCQMRDIACGDCVVGALLSIDVELDEPERRALHVLASAGMVPPLRLALPAAEAS